MDSASEISIKCKNLFILDSFSSEKVPKILSNIRKTAGFRQTNNSAQNQVQSQYITRETFALVKEIQHDVIEVREAFKQAIICPIKWPMKVKSSDIIMMQGDADDSEQFTLKLMMMPNGDKYINMRIEGLKIFTKL